MDSLNPKQNTSHGILCKSWTYPCLLSVVPLASDRITGVIVSASPSLSLRPISSEVWEPAQTVIVNTVTANLDNLDQGSTHLGTAREHYYNLKAHFLFL